ncbi:class I SAM-dependent methyltransferase [Marinicella sp. W31]|uniref:class I SAM-dependent methyltransferase n=1 Tax=Marinicella sp. W31 TaxID=3023713 RepID=UPI0037563EF8
MSESLVKYCLQQFNLEPDKVLNLLPDDLKLRLSGDILTVEDEQQNLSLHIDFDSGAMAHRARQHPGAEKLIKACKIQGKAEGQVLDATAGMGRDAFLLQQAGFQVTATERHPVVYALLQNALDRHRIAANGHVAFELLNQSAEVILAEKRFDVVYLDPMFPNRSKSAQVKKDMFVLQKLLQGTETGMESLLKAAQSAANKLVIKRPIKAVALLATKPTYQLLGKTCRFDVYQLA